MLDLALEMKTINPQMDLVDASLTIDNNIIEAKRISFCGRVYNRYKQLRTVDQRMLDAVFIYLGLGCGSVFINEATKENTKHPIESPIILGTVGSILIIIGCSGLVSTIHAYCKAILLESNLNLNKASRELQ